MSYNGWTNYQTWRVNLEIFDGQAASDLGITDTGIQSCETLKAYVEELLSEQGTGIVLDYALSFIQDVDWREIAEHLLEA